MSEEGRSMRRYDRAWGYWMCRSGMAVGILLGALMFDVGGWLLSVLAAVGMFVLAVLLLVVETWQRERRSAGA